MSGAAGIDYSVWDHIYVSDDEDVTSPFVDTSSLFRMRHRVSTETYYMDDFYDSITKSKGKVDSKSKKMREAISTVKMYQNKQTLAFGNKNMARLERMAEFQQRGDDLENNFAECKRRLEEAERHLKQLEARRSDGKEDEERDTELKKVQAVVEKLKEDQKSFGRLIREYRQEEKTLPWNVDTLSKEGFSKSVLNITTVADKETEEQKMEKQKTFVEKHTKEIKHFGMLHRWDDSQKYLSDNPHLVCEETANCLVVVCIDFEIDEKHALMEQVAHQAIVMKFILDLAETLKVDPRGCFRQFFSKIKTADQPYQDAFNRELESLKDRVRGCARIRMESAMKELEEEERQERLGPGGLDPVEVYQSLPKEMQKSFDDKNIEMLQEVMNRLSPEEAKYHLRRCIDSGLWVPESDEETNGEEDY